MKILDAQQIPATERTFAPYYAWLIYAAAGYQWALCFINTNLFFISPWMVAAVQAFIVALAAMVVLRSVEAGRRYLLYTFALIAYFLSLLIARPVELEIIGDIILPVTFFFLGKRLGNLESLDEIIWKLARFVLIIACIEYLLPYIYFKYFDIQNYYITRDVLHGNLDYLGDNIIGKNVNANGIRFTGRYLFPILGNQRLGSIFMEPVSMGNFAALLAAWGLSFGKQERARSLRYLLTAVLFVIAADSRFGSFVLVVLILVALFPTLRMTPVLLGLPVAAVLILCGLYVIAPSQAVNDTALGRLVRSGASLYKENIFQWMGFGMPHSLPDMGIAFTIEHFGVVLAAILWTIFALIHFQTQQGKTFRAMAAFYAICILMISGTSFYSSKTAALLWFAMGTLAAQPRAPSARKTI